MKSLIWEAPRIMHLREQATPEIGPGEVLVRVAFAGICGSELSGYLGHNALRVPPLVMGHEFSGHIAALGGEVRGLTEGQAVTVNPLVTCGHCRFCARGLDHLCTQRKLIGAHRPGAYAEFVSAPAVNVHGLPEKVPLRIGALTEPMAVAVRIGELAGPLPGEAALVMGAGPIGLLALQALKANGASPVFIADLSPERLAMGKALGGEALHPEKVNVIKTIRAATHTLGVAVAVDAVGTAVTRAQCVAATRSAGVVILCGLHEETSAMPAAEIIRREINMHGSFAYTAANFADALQRLARSEMRLDPWIIEAPLAEGGQWFERLITAPGKVAKVLLIP
ncbi:MAG: alcohol dehydrogenase catalytic domain-containing protein [Anaerolineales bacterium]